MSDCKQPCAGCAFSHGAAANKEMFNHLRGLVCMLGPLPFVCHDGRDWKNPSKEAAEDEISGPDISRD